MKNNFINLVSKEEQFNDNQLMEYDKENKCDNAFNVSVKDNFNTII